MSLIIKGMEMPQAGDMIICGQIDGRLQCTIVTRGKPIKWCEASEVSAPHGRPIDADRLKSMIEKCHCNGCDNYNGARCSACCVDDCFRYIDDIPTIIEAEGVNENS